MFRSGWNLIPESIESEIEQVRANHVLYGLAIVVAGLHFWFNSFGTIGAQTLNR